MELEELSRARQVLTEADLAPGTEATIAVLTAPARRPPQPLDPVPQEVFTFEPTQKVNLNKKLFLESLRKAPRGSAAALAGFAL